MNALVIGVRRTGKSTLAFSLAAERALIISIWDPNNNFRNPDFITATNEKELQQAFDRLRDWKTQGDGFLFDPAPERSQELIVIRYLPHPNHIAQEFETFARVVRDRMSGTYALLIDESDEDIQNRQGMSDMLAWYMRRAPTEQDAPETVHVIQMTHSPQDVYSRARNLLTDVYVFRTNGEPELEWIETYAQNPEAAEIARNLSTPTKANPKAPRHVLHISDGPGGEKQIEVLTNQSTWYRDIGSNRGDKRFSGEDFKPPALKEEGSGDARSD